MAGGGERARGREGEKIDRARARNLAVSFISAGSRIRFPDGHAGAEGGGRGGRIAVVSALVPRTT